MRLKKQLLHHQIKIKEIKYDGMDMRRHECDRTPNEVKIKKREKRNKGDEKKFRTARIKFSLKFDFSFACAAGCRITFLFMPHIHLYYTYTQQQ